MRDIDTVIFHHSGSLYGDYDFIKHIHVNERGFSDIGYHYLIYNAYPTYVSYRNRQPDYFNDGIVVKGRPIEIMGAHTHGGNKGSIGICLIGDKVFSGEQLDSAIQLVLELESKYGRLKARGHSDYGKATCPQIDMDYFRGLIDNARALNEI